MALLNDIRAATQHQHTSLNLAITRRLPLALPPYCHDRGVYARAMIHFAEVFFAFESTWPKSNQNSSDLERAVADLLPGQGVEKNIRRFACLQDDLMALGISAAELPPLTHGKGTAKEQLWIDHIKAMEPHRYVAYAWIFYAAIFSGGRWVREQLVQAGGQTNSFWRVPHAQAAAGSKLRFWFFDRRPVNDDSESISFSRVEGQTDGNDLKEELKQRINHLDTLLTAKQRQDIIEEAQYIFDESMRVVVTLDRENASRHMALGTVLLRRGIAIWRRSRGVVSMISIAAGLVALLISWTFYQ